MRIFQGHSALANEAIGTFLFVLIGTSAITAINITGQATTSAVMLVGSLAFAISLGWLVYTLRRTGLVHLNPVTTLYFLIQGKTSVVQALTYIVSQLFGAISASVVVALLYGTAGVETRLGADSHSPTFRFFNIQSYYNILYYMSRVSLTPPCVN